jgi:hypothetical protein
MDLSQAVIRQLARGRLDFCCKAEVPAPPVLSPENECFVQLCHGPLLPFSHLPDEALHVHARCTRPAVPDELHHCVEPSICGFNQMA